MRRLHIPVCADLIAKGMTDIFVMVVIYENVLYTHQ